MTPAEAHAALDEVYSRADPQVDTLCNVIDVATRDRRIPQLMRVAAMANLVGASAGGLASLDAGMIGKVHKVEFLPDIIIALRAAADLFEHANKSRTN